MKTTFHFKILVLILGLATAASAADTLPIYYNVSFKGADVATQTVSIVESAGLTTVSASFEAKLPVFIALQTYSEELSATFRADGTVVRLGAIRFDNGARTAISGTRLSNGLLRVVRTDMNGGSTNSIAREDYDFNSLILYGTAPADFLPTNNPVRVLSVADGRVVPISIETISESKTTPERQHLASKHLIWTDGPHISNSWHPERYSNLPDRYIRQTENGEFTFTLLR